ncbi:hypothetical protein BU24DRAFT_459780 [Aaosphaeria arxii CBS 175.79]|uniref:Uncharacterized protein n=1 Tax=Aaosphaeria arxii CBS 175.79 TaxID=1450172 RepID=A0A6A5Y5Q1_9PLEO|nr:uncharacterized protein BU24DRAFT_459780 [Aaosphaeria arxii CBS 175.79]KAF2020171.1 hypothetical protein BU24DRAFT_459780 [Aaosphaeria arxii CBS 175.79]
MSFHTDIVNCIRSKFTKFMDQTVLLATLTSFFILYYFVVGSRRESCPSKFVANVNLNQSEAYMMVPKDTHGCILDPINNISRSEARSGKGLPSYFVIEQANSIPECEALHSSECAETFKTIILVGSDFCPLSNIYEENKFYIHDALKDMYNLIILNIFQALVMIALVECLRRREASRVYQFCQEMIQDNAERGNEIKEVDTKLRKWNQFFDKKTDNSDEQSKKLEYDIASLQAELRMQNVEEIRGQASKTARWIEGLIKGEKEFKQVKFLQVCLDEHEDDIKRLTSELEALKTIKNRTE